MSNYKSMSNYDKEAKIKGKKKIILDALKRCLAKNVYSKITIQDVADEAGFSKGGLLHYFPSKEDLFLDLIDDMFAEVTLEQQKVLSGNLLSSDKASISALYSIEKFVMDTLNVRILINLVLYAYEEEKVRDRLRDGAHRMLELYTQIINGTRKDTPARRKTDMSPQFIGRIAEMVVLSAGFFEYIDPIDVDPNDLARYVVSLLK